MFVQDLRQAARAMSKHPGYLATALLTMALGIGFSTATFSVVNAVLLRPLPYANPHELLTLRERRLPQFPEFSVSPVPYLAWREYSTLFQGIGAWQVQLRNLDTGSAEPERAAHHVRSNWRSAPRSVPAAAASSSSSSSNSWRRHW
jgi:hypothetical protein